MSADNSEDQTKTPDPPAPPKAPPATQAAASDAITDPVNSNLTPMTTDVETAPQAFVLVDDSLNPLAISLERHFDPAVWNEEGYAADTSCCVGGPDGKMGVCVSYGGALKSCGLLQRAAMLNGIDEARNLANCSGYQRKEG